MENIENHVTQMKPGHSTGGFCFRYVRATPRTIERMMLLAHPAFGECRTSTEIPDRGTTSKVSTIDPNDPTTYFPTIFPLFEPLRFRSRVAPRPQASPAAQCAQLLLAAASGDARVAGRAFSQRVFGRGVPEAFDFNSGKIHEVKLAVVFSFEFNTSVVVLFC